MRPDQAPGAGLLQPATLAALTVLTLNDHVLKAACPSFLTGKLSDFAGLLLLPLFLHGVLELLSARALGRPLTTRAANRLLYGAIALSTLAFALPELWLPAEKVYRYGLGAAQWPFAAAWALLHDRLVPAWLPVRATADASDLLALPMAWVALRVGRRADPIPLASGVQRLLVPIGVLAIGLTSTGRATAGAKVPFSHEGFYLALEVGAGGGFVDSTGSVSNGFAQEIRSQARAIMAPIAGFEIGSTLLAPGLVLGGRLGFGSAREPVIETLGRRFKVRSQELVHIEVFGIAKYYLDPRSGLHLGIGLGTAALGVSDGTDGANFGFGGSLELGHAFFFARQWSVGATARITATRTVGRNDRDVATSFLMPALLAVVTYH